MLVSVYMPTKNRLESLKAAVNSVLSQTYDNLELIVVDDASTDGTPDYLSHMQSLEPRIKVIRQETSKGACVARNLAIRASSGHFVTGLDDDDEFTPHHIASLVAAWPIINASHPEVSSLYVNYLYRDNGKLTEGVKKASAKYDDMYKANHVGNQLFALRQTYFDAGLFDEEMPAWQDLEFFYRILKKQGPARLVDVNTYIFDVTPRDDRISSGRKDKIIYAFNRMVKMNNINNKRDQQYLLLQVYSKYYGFKVDFSDLLFFFGKGFWISGWLFMIQRFFGISPHKH